MTSASKPPACYPRFARVRTRAAFQRIVRKGDVFPGRECLVRRCANDGPCARLGIATPRRYGKAVRRNRFRRLVREAFRQIRETLGAHDYFVTPRRHLAEPTLEGIRADLVSVLHRSPAPPKKRA